MRLNDFAIVQSNTLRYAFVTIFTAITCGLLYALTRWLLGMTLVRPTRARN